MWLMKRAFFSQRQALERAVRALGVTGAQAGVLARLSEEPGLSGSELGRRLLITPQAAQVVLASLEARSLIEREPDPNHGRIMRAYLTKDGRRIAKACAAAAFEVQETLLVGVDDRELATLVEVLHRLIENAQGRALTDAS